MKIIFASPFKPLWNEDIEKLSSLLNAEIVGHGDLLRNEVKCESELGIELNSAMNEGKVISPNLMSKIIIERFFDDQSNKILVGYPSLNFQAASLVSDINASEYNLDAVVAVDIGKKLTLAKFSAQYHCDVNLAHPRVESTGNHPSCSICASRMTQSYNLDNEKLLNLIDSYYEESTGGLAAAEAISKGLNASYINFTTPEHVLEQILY